MSLLKACSNCGELSTRSKCEACRPSDPRPSGTARGYDSAWRRLSKRARRLSPMCEDCGAVDDLSVDHTPQAWARHEAGLPIRLEDLGGVVCRRCNSRRGAARGPAARTEPTTPPAKGGRVDPPSTSKRPSGKAKFASHMRTILSKEGDPSGGSSESRPEGEDHG